MARPKSLKPKHCCHKATRRGFVILNGDWHYTGPPGSWGTQAANDEYDRLIGEWIARGRRPAGQVPATTGGPAEGSPAGAGPGLTVAQLVKAYWLHCKQRHAKWIVRDDAGRERFTGELDNIRQALKPLVRLYGATLIVGSDEKPGFGPLKLKALRSHLIAAGRCRNYVNRTVRRFVAVFAWAQTAELIGPMVHHALTTLPPLVEGEEGVRESEPVGSVADARVDAVLDLLPGPVRAIVELQALTGARGDELRRLRTRDVDRTNPKAWEYRPRKHKTSHKKKGRFIPFGPQSQEILTPYLKLHAPDAYCFSPADAEAERHRVQRKERKSDVTPSQRRRAELARRRVRQRPPREFYDQYAYRRAISRACEVAFKMPKELRKPVKKPAVQTPEAIEQWAAAEKARRAAASAWRRANVWKPHQLRHSVVTKMRHRYGEEVASLVAGHAKLSTTALYGEQNEQKVREIAEAIG